MYFNVKLTYLNVYITGKIKFANIPSYSFQVKLNRKKEIQFHITFKCYFTAFNKFLTKDLSASYSYIQMKAVYI